MEKFGFCNTILIEKIFDKKREINLFFTDIDKIKEQMLEEISVPQ